MSGCKGIKHRCDHHGILGHILAQCHETIGLAPQGIGDHGHQQQCDKGIEDQCAAGSGHRLQQPEIFIYFSARCLFHCLLRSFLSVNTGFSAMPGHREVPSGPIPAPLCGKYSTAWPF